MKICMFICINAWLIFLFQLYFLCIYYVHILSYILCIYYMVKCSFPDLILESKMGDSLETRISTVEHMQEEFGHDIQEMKGQLAQLIKLIEGHIGIVLEDIHGSSFNPLQSSSYPLVQHHHLHSSYEPRISVRGNIPPKVHYSNWQPHAPTPVIC